MDDDIEDIFIAPPPRRSVMMELCPVGTYDRLRAAEDLAEAAAHLLAHLNDGRRLPGAVAELRRTLNAYETHRGDAAGAVALAAHLLRGEGL